MADDLLNDLVQKVGDNYPYTTERLNQIINEAEENDFESLLTSNDIEGPTDEFITFARNWIENLAVTSQADELGEDWRNYLVKFSNKHADCAEYLPGWCSAIISALEAVLKTNNHVTIWVSLDASLDYVDRCLQIEILKSAADDIAQTVSSEFQESYPSLQIDDDFADFEYLEESLASLFKLWAKKVSGKPAIYQELIFIDLFIQNILPVNTGNETFWQSLIELKLLNAVDEKLGVYTHHILSDVLNVLNESCARFDCIFSLREEIPRLLEDCSKSHLQFIDILIAVMILHTSKDSNLTERFVANLSRDFFGSENTNREIIVYFIKNKRTVLDWLRENHERLYIDWFEDTLGYFKNLLQYTDSIENNLKLLKPKFSKLGEDLAVGLKGANMGSRLLNFISEIFSRACWAGSVTKNPKLASHIFRQGIVASMGLDARDEIWRKHARIQAALLNDLTEQKINSVEVVIAKTLIQTIESITLSTKLAPGDLYLDNTTLSRVDLDSLNLKSIDVSLAIKRITVDQRLFSERTFLQSTEEWFFNHILSRLGPVSGLALKEVFSTLGGGIKIADKDDEVPANFSKAYEQFTNRLPRLTASINLYVNAEKVAKDSTKYLFDKITNLKSEVGDDGYNTTIKENRLTCIKIGRTLSPASKISNDQFAGWWNRTIERFIINRPSGMFEEMLNGYYRGMNNVLSGEETEQAFDVIHNTFKEILGVSCTLAAVGSKSCPIAGPGWRSLFGSSKAKPMPKSFELNAEDIEIAAGNLADYKDTVIKQFNLLVKNFIASGDVEYSWQKVMPMIDQTLKTETTSGLAKAYINFAFELADAVGGAKGVFWFETIHRGSFIVAQIGLAQKLADAIDEIANEYARHAYNIFPDEYNDVGEAEAVSKIMADQTALLNNFSNILRQESPTLAYLNIVRYMIELVAPYKHFSGSVWKSGYRYIEKFLSDKIDNFEHYALSFWVSQLESMCDNINETHGLAKEIYTSGEYTFSARVEEEDAIRMCVSSVTAASIAPDSASITPDAVLSRFALSSALPNFKSPKQLEQLNKLILNTLEGLLPENFEYNLKQLGKKFSRINSLSKKSGDLSVAAAFIGVSDETMISSFWKTVSIGMTVNEDSKSQLAKDNAILKEHHINTHSVGEIAASVAALDSQWFMSAIADTAQKRLLQTSLHAVVTNSTSGEKNISYDLISKTAARNIGFMLGFSDDLNKVDDYGFIDVAGLDIADKTPLNEKITQSFRLIKSKLGKVNFGIKLAKKVKEISKQLSADCQKIESLTESFGDTKTYAAFIKRVAYRLIDSNIEPARLMAGKVVENYRLFNLDDVNLLYAKSLEAMLTVASETERVYVHQAIFETQLNSTIIETKNWKSIFASSEEEAAEFIDKAIASISQLAEKSAEDTITYFGKGDKTVIQTILVRELEVFITAIKNFGDIEYAWKLLTPLVDEDIDVVGTAVLARAYYCLNNNLDEILENSSVAFWHQIWIESAELVGQVGAGKIIHNNLVETAKLVSDQILKNFPTIIGEKEKEIVEVSLNNRQLLNLSNLGLQLRTEPSTVAALNLARLYLESSINLIDLPRLALLCSTRYIEDSLIEKCDAVERAALVKWLSQLRLFKSNIPTAKILSEKIFLTNEQIFSESKAIDAKWRESASYLIASALTPDSAPVPGKALLQRAIISNETLFALDAAQWNDKSNELLELFKQWSTKKLPSGLAKRLAEISRLKEAVTKIKESKGHGLGAALGIFSKLRISKSLWIGTFLARADVKSGLGMQNATDMIISQQHGWDIPEDSNLISGLKLIGSVWSLKENIESIDVKKDEEEKSGGIMGFFKGKKKSESSKIDTPEIRKEASYILRNLSVVIATNTSVEYTAWLFGFLGTADNFSNKNSDGALKFYRGLSIFINQRFGDQTPIGKSVSTYILKLETVALGYNLINSGSEFSGKCSTSVGTSEQAVKSMLRLMALYAIGVVDYETADAYTGVETSGDKSTLDLIRDNSESFNSVIKESIAKSTATKIDSCLQPLYF